MPGTRRSRRRPKKPPTSDSQALEGQVPWCKDPALWKLIPDFLKLKPSVQGGPPALKLEPSVQREPPVGQHQPPVMQREPPVWEHQPPVMQRKPPVWQHQPPTRQRETPVWEHQPPAMQREPPVWEHQPPVMQREPPVMQREPPVWEHQPPVMQREPPVGQHQPSVMQREPPVGEHQPPTRQREPPVWEHQPPVMEREPPVGEHQPPVMQREPPALKLEPSVQRGPPAVKLEPLVQGGPPAGEHQPPTRQRGPHVWEHQPPTRQRGPHVWEHQPPTRQRGPHVWPNVWPHQPHVWPAWPHQPHVWPAWQPQSPGCHGKGSPKMKSVPPAVRKKRDRVPNPYSWVKPTNEKKVCKEEAAEGLPMPDLREVLDKKKRENDDASSTAAVVQDESACGFVSSKDEVMIIECVRPVIDVITLSSDSETEMEPCAGGTLFTGAAAAAIPTPPGEMNPRSQCPDPSCSAASTSGVISPGSQGSDKKDAAKILWRPWTVEPKSAALTFAHPPSPPVNIEKPSAGGAYHSFSFNVLPKREVVAVPVASRAPRQPASSTPLSAFEPHVNDKLAKACDEGPLLPGPASRPRCRSAPTEAPVSTPAPKRPRCVLRATSLVNLTGTGQPMALSDSARGSSGWWTPTRSDSFQAGWTLAAMRTMNFRALTPFGPDHPPRKWGPIPLTPPKR